jgi:hypothetical protein
MRHLKTARRAAAAAVAMLAMASLCAPSAANAAAAAGLKKTKQGPCLLLTNGPEHSRLCLYKIGDDVAGYVNYNDTLERTVYVNAWLYVQRCQAIDNRPENCTTIAAVSKGAWTSGGTYFGLRTPDRPAQFGWIYRACASLNTDETSFSYVNECSPWVTGNPEEARIIIG